MRALDLGLCLLLPWCGACGPAPSAGFDGATSSEKMDAILDAARHRDADAAARIVEQLDSDDPAVRMAAVSALETLVDERPAYRHHHDPADRDAAVEWWIDRLRSRPAPEGQEKDLNRYEH